MPVRTFEQWVDGIFDHPVTRREWYWDPDADTCVEPDAATNVAYLTRLFTESDRVLRRFDSGQAGQGLWMIAYSACSDHAWSIVLDDAPWPARREAIRAIYDLNEKCFAQRCVNAFDTNTELPLDSICYMWWDLFPATGDPASPSPRAEETDEYIGVMERCLSLAHYKCLHGALHGLGHWHSAAPARVEEIIDRFLKQRDDLTPELVLYARRAREGAVQ